MWIRLLRILILADKYIIYIKAMRYEKVNIIRRKRWHRVYQKFQSPVGLFITAWKGELYNMQNLRILEWVLFLFFRKKILALK